MQKSNIVRKRVLEGKPSFGPFIFSGSPVIVETFGSTPFHFVFHDMEHTPFTSFESLANLIRAADAVNLVSLVRVYENNPFLIGKAIELGAMGVVVPHVNNRDDALKAVEGSRFAPHGLRGHCPIVREFDYGGLQSFDYGKLTHLISEFEREDREVMVIGLIEEERAVRNIDDILSTDIDGVLFGAGDLSMTLGIAEAAGQMFHPKVLEARNEVVRRCKEARKPVMCSAAQFLENGTSLHDAVKLWVPKGVLIWHIGVDICLLLARCFQLLEEVKGFLK